MDRSNPSISDRLSAPATTDDESITTSTESDTFDTWTLVTDKKNPERKIKVASSAHPDETSERVEILPSEENKKTKTDKQDEAADIHKEEQQDTSLDELSDGISVISESESGGRLSPHPFLQKHLDDLNIKFTIGDEMDTLLPPELPDLAPRNVTVLPYAYNLEVLDDQAQLRLRRRKSRSRSKSIEKEVAEVASSGPVVPGTGCVPSLVRRGLTGLFYGCVALAILAFIGRIRTFEWSAVPGSKPIANLEEKLTNMELQNNLMRAEIDILTRQVNYLSTSKNPNQRGRPQQKYDRKTFKAWPGNGDSIDPVEITKEDLKRPYRCPDGKFVEIAGMCMENAQEKPPIIDQIGEAFHDVLQQSEAYRKFEKLNDKLHAFAENPFADSETAEPSKVPNTQNPTGGHVEGQDEFSGKEPKDNRQQPRERLDKFGGSSKERNQQPQGKQKKWEKNHHEQQKRRHDHDNRSKQYRNDFDDDDDDDDDSRERFNRKFNSKERQNKSERRESKERHSGHRSSKERHDAKPRPHSKERHHSKENFEKQRRKSGSGERFHKDGHWHEKMMQQRENARRQNENQRNEKNWYIERGDSREQMRLR